MPDVPPISLPRDPLPPLSARSSSASQAAVAAASPTSRTATASSPTSPTAAPTLSPCSTSSISARTAPCRSAPTPPSLAVNPHRNEVYVVNTQSGTVFGHRRENQPHRRHHPCPPPALLHQRRSHRPPRLRRQLRLQHRQRSRPRSPPRDRRCRHRRAARARPHLPRWPLARRHQSRQRQCLRLRRRLPTIAASDVRTASAPPRRLSRAVPEPPMRSSSLTPPRPSSPARAAIRSWPSALRPRPAPGPRNRILSLMTDHLLTLLDVGKTPVHLALKPDGGEIFVSNFGSDSISEIVYLDQRSRRHLHHRQQACAGRCQPRQQHALGRELRRGLDRALQHRRRQAGVAASTPAQRLTLSRSLTTSTFCSPPTPIPGTLR